MCTGWVHSRAWNANALVPPSQACCPVNDASVGQAEPLNHAQHAGAQFGSIGHMLRPTPLPFCSVLNAQITTKGDKVLDVFTVARKEGGQLPDKLWAQVREGLSSVVGATNVSDDELYFQVRTLPHLRWISVSLDSRSSILYLAVRLTPEALASCRSASRRWSPFVSNQLVREVARRGRSARWGR